MEAISKSHILCALFATTVLVGPVVTGGSAHAAVSQSYLDGICAREMFTRREIRSIQRSAEFPEILEYTLEQCPAVAVALTSQPTATTPANPESPRDDNPNGGGGTGGDEDGGDEGDGGETGGGETGGGETPGPGKNVGGPGKNVGGPGKNVGGPGKNVGGPGKNVGGPGRNSKDEDKAPDNSGEQGENAL